MLEFSRWKTAAVLGLTIVVCLAAVPSVLPAPVFAQLPHWAQRAVPLGMDLRGGSHTVFEVDEAWVRRHELERLRDDVRRMFREARVGYSALSIHDASIEIRPRDASNIPRMVQQLNDFGRPYPGHGGIDRSHAALLPDPDGRPILTAVHDGRVLPAIFDVTSDDAVIRLVVNEAVIKENVTARRDAGIHVMTRRLRELGADDFATVRARGADRVVIDSKYPDAIERLRSLQF